MFIASVGTALPPNRYEQPELIAAIKAIWAQRHFNPARVDQLHTAVQVGYRHLALPLDAYAELADFGAANDAFIRVGTELGEAAIREALATAQLVPADVDAIFFTTVTGLAVPTIDARLVNRLGLRSDIRRTPLFGLGCLGGAAGVARMADYLKAWPDHVAVLLSVELCSLTLQSGDLSIPNLIASGLFGDGAAAVVGVGEARANLSGLRVVASRSAFYPNSERVMGWDIGPDGFKIVLSASVPQMVRDHLGHDVDAFLAAHELSRDDIATWVCHPGGPKVLDAMTETLGLEREDLSVTWRSLRDVGNLSSASVLFVLGETLTQHEPPVGSYGLMMAMGPGFCAELVLLQW